MWMGPKRNVAAVGPTQTGGAHVQGPGPMVNGMTGGAYQMARPMAGFREGMGSGFQMKPGSMPAAGPGPWLPPGMRRPPRGPGPMGPGPLPPGVQRPHVGVPMPGGPGPWMPPGLLEQQRAEQGALAAAGPEPGRWAEPMMQEQQAQGQANQLMAMLGGGQLPAPVMDLLGQLVRMLSGAR